MRSILLLVAAAVAFAAPEPTLWKPYYTSPRAAARHIALDRDWQLGWRDVPAANMSELRSVKKWIPVATPATVHWALYKAGELPHPYLNRNSEQYRWVETKAWYYRKTFTLPETARGNYVTLAFDGLDYFARIWLNGELLGRHEGMYGGPDVEISKRVRYGAENEIVVELRSGNWGRWKEDMSRKPGPVIRGWVFAGGAAAEAFHTLGMWRGARVEITPKAHIERPFLTTEAITATSARLRFSVELFVDRHSTEETMHGWTTMHATHFRNSFTSKKVTRPLQVRVELREADGRVAATHTVPATAFMGRNYVEGAFTLPSPKLWWPNGMGAQPLYRVEVTLLDEGRATDKIAFDYGVRTLTTERSAGPRTEDIWHDWQFVVNGRKFFVKGVNWMPADLLLDLPRERYEWLIAMAKNAGIQMFRIWGAGLIETEEFYDACNRHGILVWQDFTVSNMQTPDWPQDVWEAQVVRNIFRIRNQPSLAVYCGGNESNPYALGNAASIGIFERSVAEFDRTRPFRRTSPDGGGIHQYPDKDPTWYGKEYRDVPFIAETGMHNIPEGRSMREVVDAKELATPFTNMYSEQFAREHPEFRHHFGEWGPSRVPRMVSRASQIADMSAPTIEDLAEASQFGAGEFYQILSEQVQANYPVTTGLLPWVYKRPWPIVAIMLADAFGQPTAPYYFLKRTYEPTHVSLFLPEIMWAPGEKVPLDARITHSLPRAVAGTISVEALDDKFTVLQKQSRAVHIAPGPSVASVAFDAFSIPAAMRDRYFFLKIELRNAAGTLISRSVYWPRSLARMEDKAFRDKYRATPQPAMFFDKGPWLKPAIAATGTTLVMTVLNRKDTADRSTIRLSVRNAGKLPAYPVSFEIDGAKRAFYATDSHFWLGAGEQREVTLEVLWREPATKANAKLSVKAWNAR